jgi:hypothetical protein
MYQTHKIPQLSAEKSFKIEMLHNTSFSLTTDTFLCLSGAMMDFHPQMLWSLFCSLIKVRIVDFGGMVGSHFKLLHKEKNTKVNVTCSHVWLFTPPHILANSVAAWLQAHQLWCYSCHTIPQDMWWCKEPYMATKVDGPVAMYGSLHHHISWRIVWQE